MEHDASYTLLFSHARMVEDLLRGFVRESWVDEVDFATLERWSENQTSDTLQQRRNDVIWRLRWGSEWLYLYLLLEFQSTVDSYMAVRFLVYIGLLYQSLIRAQQLSPSGHLPPVIPIVLYNGRGHWSAMRTVEALLAQVPWQMARYAPRLRYIVLDESRYSEQDLAPLRNVVAALFRLENSREPTDVQHVLGTLLDWLQSPQEIVYDGRLRSGYGGCSYRRGCPASPFLRCRIYWRCIRC